MRLMRFAAGCLGLAAGGCGPPAIEGGFDSPNPAAKLFAIQYAAQQRDVAAVPHLVEQLDSEDPAVRMMAISALQDICGETCGYSFSDPRWKRDQAVQCWVEAVQSGRFTISTHGSSVTKLAESEERGG